MNYQVTYWISGICQCSRPGFQALLLFKSKRMAIRFSRAALRVSTEYCSYRPATLVTSFRQKAFASSRVTSYIQANRQLSYSMAPKSEKTENSEGSHPSQHQQDGEAVDGKHEWKTRPPYQIHNSNEDFDVKHEAECHCGRVKYQLSREDPLDSKLCHCTTCQKQHGTSLNHHNERY